MRFHKLCGLLERIYYVNFYWLKIIYKFRKFDSLVSIFFFIFYVTACNSEQNVVDTSTASIFPAATVTAASPSKTPTITLASFSQGVSTTLATKSAPPLNWQYQWLKSIPCRPPCWEGITPGRSTLTETLKLLEQNPLIADYTMPKSDGKNEDYILWNWFDNPKNISGTAGKGGTIGYDSKTNVQTITYIQPKLSTIKLGDVIQAYGMPTHIIATFDVPLENFELRHIVKFIYLTQGFVVSNVILNLPNPIPSIDKDLLLEKVTFFTPNIDGYKVFDPSLTKLMIPWQGFNEFKFYCRQANRPPKFEIEDCSGVRSIGAP